MESAKKIYDKFSKESRETLDESLKGQEENPYVRFLIEKLSGDQYDLKELIMYGMSDIPEMIPNEPLINLSSYFFLLSELEGISPEIRDFVLEVSVWCEGAYEYNPNYRNLNPSQLYLQKIEPLLP